MVSHGILGSDKVSDYFGIKLNVKFLNVKIFG